MMMEIPRGDSLEKGFVLKDKQSGEPITDVYDEIYFTVKSDAKERDYLFQKTMTAGGITDDGNGHYTLIIMPDDTNDLEFDTYDCDFEFVKDEHKRTFYGKLKLTKEVTHYYNE